MRRWLITTVAPQKDFLGPIIDAQQREVLLKLLLLIVAIFTGVVFARHLARPIRALSVEVEHIKHLDDVLRLQLCARVNWKGHERTVRPEQHEQVREAGDRGPEVGLRAALPDLVERQAFAPSDPGRDRHVGDVEAGPAYDRGQRAASAPGLDDRA